MGLILRLSRVVRVSNGYSKTSGGAMHKNAVRFRLPTMKDICSRFAIFPQSQKSQRSRAQNRDEFPTTLICSKLAYQTTIYVLGEVMKPRSRHLLAESIPEFFLKTSEVQCQRSVRASCAGETTEPNRSGHFYLEEKHNNNAIQRLKAQGASNLTSAASF